MNDLGILALGALATGQPQPVLPVPQPDNLQAMRSHSDVQLLGVIPATLITPPEFTPPNWSPTRLEPPAPRLDRGSSVVKRTSTFEKSLFAAEDSYIKTILN